MQHTDIEKIHKIAIVGAGPAGLSAVASLLQQAQKNPTKKFTVNLFEKRDANYQRRQKIVIYKDPTQEKSIRWDEFCLKLFYPNGVIKIDSHGTLLNNGTPFPLPLNARQKLLKKMLRQRNAEEINVTIRSLELALKEHIDANKVSNVEINWHVQTSIENVDVKQQIITAKKENQIQDFEFDTLILSEGRKREVTKKINTAIKNENISIDPFRFKKIGVNKYLGGGGEKLYYPWHFAARMVEKTNIPHEFLKDDEDQACAVIRKLGWDHPNFPYHTDDNLWKKGAQDWHLRFYLVGVMTKEINDIKNPIEKKEALLDLARALAAIKYRIPMKFFDLDTKGPEKLHISSFNLNIKSVDNPVRRLPGGGDIILIGDCAMTPFHHTGFSSQMALNEALKSMECLVQKDNADKYENFVKRYHAYEKYLQEFIAAEFHELLYMHPEKEVISKTKDIQFLADQVKVNKKDYNLNISDEIEMSENVNQLKNKIQKLENEANNGNFFAAYALAQQLEEGVEYLKLVNGYFRTSTLKDPTKSLFYWQLLKQNGYAVDEHIKSLSQQLSPFDEWMVTFSTNKTDSSSQATEHQKENAQEDLKETFKKK